MRKADSGHAAQTGRLRRPRPAQGRLVVRHLLSVAGDPAGDHEADLVVGGAGRYLLAAVEDLGHGPLHVGLAGAQPHVTKEDTVERQGGGDTISYNNVAGRTGYL